MPLPKAQLQILAYLIRREDEGATVGEIRQEFGLTVNDVTSWVAYLRNQGFIEAMGDRGRYRYRVTRSCLDRIRLALGEAEQATGGRWKWLGVAALLVILLGEEKVGR